MPNAASPSSRKLPLVDPLGDMTGKKIERLTSTMTTKKKVERGRYFTLQATGQGLRRRKPGCL